MCVVSNISDYGRQIQWEEWNPTKYRDFSDLIEKAKQFDKAHGQPDCVDPEKQKFLDELDKRFKRLEDMIEKVVKG